MGHEDHGMHPHDHGSGHPHHRGDPSDFPMRGRGPRGRMRFARGGGHDHDDQPHGGPGHRGGPPPWVGGGRGGWGGPPWGGPGGGRGPRRRRRGETRGALLGLLAESPMHGYQLIQELESRTEGTWRASPGSVYPTLQMLEDQGLIRGTDDDGRRVFELTDEGRSAVEQLGDGARPWEAEAGGEMPLAFQVMRAVQQLAMAAHQVAHATADEAALTRALAIVEDGRRQLYALLAEA